MPDVPNIPAVPVTPVAPVAPVTNAAPVAKAPEAKVAADNKEVKAAIEKIKLKRGEFTLEEIESRFEKADGADKKFLDASKKSKEAMRFFKMAKENPREFLAKTGLDPKKFAYDEVAEDLKNKLRDPREVELEQAQKRLKEYEEKEATAKKAKEEERVSRQAKVAEEKFHKEMIEALEAAPDVPKNGFTVAKVAKYMQVVLDKTGVLLSPKDVVSVIQRDLRSELTGVVKGASAEQLIALIGEEGVAAIRAYDLARLKDPLQNKGTGEGTINGKPVEKPRVRSNQFWKDIDRAAKAEREARGQ